ncbi:MAG: protealysin inhibitor emfourin [Anaerolineales bacterium]
MRIIFERSGGLMGLKSSLVIDLNELPLDQAATLRKLLDESHFLTLPEHPPTHATPDGFQYIITVETETITHTVHTSDATMPNELRPLLEELSQRARSQHKPKG